MEGPLSLPEELWKDASDARATRTQIDPWADALANIAESAAHIRAVNSQDTRQKDTEEDDEGTIYATGTDHDGNPEHRVSSEYVMGTGLGILVDRRTPEVAKRVGLVMRSLGWTGPKLVCIDGRSVRGYVRQIEEPWD